MSNLERDPAEAVIGGTATVATAPVRELLPGREVVLGGTRGMPVTRTLPTRGRRMVGAWCFLDHFSAVLATGTAADSGAGSGMRVPPHPHTGLQTVTWLVDGEVRHRDSLGSDQLIRPGQMNLMTAGRGIAHAEDSTAEAGPALHGVQLWVALPDRHRHVRPDFAHHPDLPVRRDPGASYRLLLGALDGAASPARTYSPIAGAEISLHESARTELPLEPDFEYAALTLSGTVTVDDVALAAGPLLYLGCGRSALALSTSAGGRVLLLGGEPFDERIVMWWNFIGRSHDEIVQARADWMAGRAFGEVRGYDGAALPAPALPTTPLLPRGRQR
jgi:hypothetical protein